MQGLLLIMYKITKSNFQNTFSYLKKHVQWNPIIAGFKRVDIILLIYKALLFHQPPHKHDSYDRYFCTFLLSQMTKEFQIIGFIM